ncbi:hypothetical protein [Streptomyces griseomycini]|uniref:Uncharacterized protein n=1 Tax=Streptomyces griseomycini TaxID=66895 RepID=A0A7W7PWI9_9ACTN|nr:hypothetical protein [Streptomyces griseomycini]MBB4902585.1 hypothetical protein [Streptomyces griseomycini]GGR54315.1 hypothetical protein GCM10015536_69560 [Streptomyces griseomycini]
MSKPRIPAKHIEQLRTALENAGVPFTATLKPGKARTFEVTHLGRTWELAYAFQTGGQAVWALTGPGADYEWGPGRFTSECVEAITAPVAEPEPEPVDPHPGAPRTHLGFELPEFVRAEWDSPRAEWFRLGLAAAVGKLPDTRPRA